LPQYLLKHNATSKKTKKNIVFFFSATEHGPHVISHVHLVLLFGSVSSSVWLPVLIMSVSQ